MRSECGDEAYVNHIQAEHRRLDQLIRCTLEAIPNCGEYQRLSWPAWQQFAGSWSSILRKKSQAAAWKRQSLDARVYQERLIAYKPSTADCWQCSTSSFSIPGEFSGPRSGTCWLWTTNCGPSPTSCECTKRKKAASCSGHLQLAWKMQTSPGRTSSFGQGENLLAERHPTWKFRARFVKIGAGSHGAGKCGPAATVPR